MATISSPMIQLLATTVITCVLATRPRHGGTQLRAVGCGQWLTALTESPHRAFFQQLLDDLKHRRSCAELEGAVLKPSLTFSSKRIPKWEDGQQPAKVGCPELSIDAGQRTSGLTQDSLIRNCAGFCFPVPRAYNYSMSTADYYGRVRKESWNDEPVYQKRKTPSTLKDIDHGYHEHYLSIRSSWQTYWIKKVVDRAPVVKQGAGARPWIIFTSGAMGVGKGYVMKWMSDRGYFGLENVVHVDPDFFKSVMPEKERYLQSSSAADAATKCHKESGMMMEVAVRQAMSARFNVWEDGSLRDADWYGQRFQSIKNTIRGGVSEYKIAIVHIVPESKEQLLAQVEKRAQEEGRGLDEWRVMDSWNASNKAVDLLKGQADFFARVQNAPGSEPRIIELLQGGKKMQQEDDVWKMFSETLGAPALQENLKPKVAGRQVAKAYKSLVEPLPHGALPGTLEEFKALLAQTQSDLSGWDGTISRLWNSLAHERDQSEKCQSTAEFLRTY